MRWVLLIASALFALSFGVVTYSMCRKSVPPDVGYKVHRARCTEEPLVREETLRKDSGMTREQLESAVASGAPFTLRMADGKEYSVPHRDYIWLPQKASYVIVHEADGHFTVLPLLTMTGLRSKTAGPGNQED